MQCVGAFECAQNMSSVCIVSLLYGVLTTVATPVCSGMKPEIDQGHDDAVKKLPATQPTLESRFSRLELLFYQQARQVDQQARQNDLQAQQIDQHAQQINKLNEFVFHPLCICQLLVEAAAMINQLDGNKHPRGNIHETQAAPPWTKSWLSSAAGTIDLSELDLEVIYVTSSGSVRGDANGAAHVIELKDQAAAVLASVSRQPQHQASLARIFTFVHGRPIQDFACV